MGIDQQHKGIYTDQQKFKMAFCFDHQCINWAISAFSVQEALLLQNVKG